MKVRLENERDRKRRRDLRNIATGYFIYDERPRSAVRYDHADARTRKGWAFLSFFGLFV